MDQPAGTSWIQPRYLFCIRKEHTTGAVIILGNRYQGGHGYQVPWGVSQGHRIIEGLDGIEILVWEEEVNILAGVEHWNPQAVYASMYKSL